MKIINKVVEANFLARPNRFIALVNLNDEEIKVHVPNTGRCKEIFTKGAKVFLRYEENENRKTKYDLIAVYKGEKLINIDSQIPNKVVHEALELKKISGLEKYNTIYREKTYKNSRFDFQLCSGDDIYYMEVKGVTLEENGLAMFPDAPTQRGEKHILELIDAKKNGFGAGILFLIQMDDINCFTPNIKTDLKFSNTLKLAHESKVDIFAFNCVVEKDSITLNKRVDISL